jgi:hypothetical protein
MPDDNKNLPAQVETGELAPADVGTALVNLVNRIGPDATTEMVAALEKMCELQIKMDAITAQKNFARDKAALQAELSSIPALGEMKEGGFVKYRFPTLDQIGAAVKPICERYGFSYSFEYDAKEVGGRMMVTTTFILLHRDGHSERTNFVCEMAEGNKLMREGFQRSGATQTASMRRAMIGGLGLTWCDPDTDGIDPGEVEKINADELDTLKKLIETIGMDKASRDRFDKWIKSRFQAETLEDLPKSAHAEITRELLKKKREIEKQKGQGAK